MTYKEALAWLYSLQRFGIKLGLDNVRRLFAALELPDAVGRILHVAGTNGKGSVCAMLDSICRAQGYRTGLFTSPHLVTFRERIQVDGKLIAESEVAEGLVAIRRLQTSRNPSPMAYQELALTYVSLGKFEEAAAAFQEMLNKYPSAKNPQLLLELGKIHRAAGKYDAALEVIREAVQRDPREGQARVLMIVPMLAGF